MAIYENTNNLSMKAWSYNNPIVIIVAVMLVDLAIQSNFRSKFINELAKGSFTCLLFHSWFFKFLEIEKVERNLEINEEESYDCIWDKTRSHQNLSPY